MQMSSQILYAAMIEAIGADTKPTRAQQTMLERVKTDYYHDFVGPLEMPAVQLVADLQHVGLDALAERAKAGAFDATQAEAKAWVASPDGQEAFRHLMS